MNHLQYNSLISFYFIHVWEKVHNEKRSYTNQPMKNLATDGITNLEKNELLILLLAIKFQITIILLSMTGRTC